MTRIIVCGGRDFKDRDWLWNGLNEFDVAVGGITELIEGGARGADQIAGLWAERKNAMHRAKAGHPAVIDGTFMGEEKLLKHTIIHADWHHHGLSAGWVRNNAMADLNPDYVFVAPGGAGTKMMVDIARRRGISRVYLDRMGIPNNSGPAHHERAQD